MSKLLEQINKDKRQTKKLGDLFEVKTGGTPSRTRPEFYSGGSIPWVKTQELVDSIIFDTDEKITGEAIKNSNAKIFPKKSVILAMYGATVGKLGRLGIDASTNQACATFIPNMSSDINFLYYLLFKNRKKIISEATGAAQQNLSVDKIRNFEFDFPTLDIQNKIAVILNAYDSKIENNNKIIKKLEFIAQTIFNEWFVNFKFPGYEKVKMVDSDIGEIPQGWSVVKVSDFGSVVCGKTPPKAQSEYFNGEFPFIKIPDMHDQMYILQTEDSLTQEGVNTQKNKLIPEGSICVSCIATVGLVSITTKDSQTNQQINTVIPKNKEFTEYLYFVLTNMKSDLQAIGSGGSTTLNVNTSVFSNLEILIPDSEVIKIFHKKVNPFFNKTKQLLEENISLKESRDQLLTKLI